MCKTYFELAQNIVYQICPYCGHHYSAPICPCQNKNNLTNQNMPANKQDFEWTVNELKFTVPLLSTLDDKSRNHLIEILKDTVAETARKYCLGWLEHGGYLPDKSTVQEHLVDAIKENIDQNVYLRTALKRLEDSLKSNC